MTDILDMACRTLIKIKFYKKDLVKENKMLTRCLTLIGLIATLLISSGCGVKETMLDRNWGKSFELAKSNQILNGPDEQVTEANIGKYRGYSKKQTSNKLENSTIQK